MSSFDSDLAAFLNKDHERDIAEIEANIDAETEEQMSGIDDHDILDDSNKKKVEKAKTKGSSKQTASTSKAANKRQKNRRIAFSRSDEDVIKLIEDVELQPYLELCM